ncbi:MAG TPA: proline dehydrogenase family protein [Kribbella sp.]|nr:proline dehydrogenase family protein [Kribbella sp.]
MLRRVLLGVSRSPQIKKAVTAMPVSSGIVARFVAGETAADAVLATEKLVSDGLTVTLDHLGEDVTDRTAATATTEAYLEMLKQLSDAGLTQHAEVSVKLSAVGQALPGDGEKIALENARTICHAARNAGTTVTLDAEDHTTTDSTLGILRELRQDFPETGAVVQAYLRRTEGDCRDLAHAGSRVRLCKGAYKEPESVAYQSKAAVDKAYVRAARILMNGAGYPMIASHDPRLIAIAGSLAARANRDPGSFEYQLLYGIRPEEQRRLHSEGHTVRVYVPYGADWYGYLVRRLAERPANLQFFLRSLISKK